jgi:membrane-associated protein
MLQSAFELVLRLPGAVAVLLVFLLPFLECSLFIGFVVPGEIAVLLGGVLANQHRVSLTAVLIAGIAGAILGDSLGYAIGHRYGQRVLARVPDRLLDAEKAERAESMVRRLGGKAVFIGRFTTAARVLVPSLAGTARIPYGRFLFFNVAGGGLWAGGFVLLGYAVGNEYPTVEHNANLAGLALLGALVIGGLIAWRHRRKSGDREPTARGGPN